LNAKLKQKEDYSVSDYPHCCALFFRLATEPDEIATFVENRILQGYLDNSLEADFFKSLAMVYDESWGPRVVAKVVNEGLFCDRTHPVFCRFLERGGDAEGLVPVLVSRFVAALGKKNGNTATPLAYLDKIILYRGQSMRERIRGQLTEEQLRKMEEVQPAWFETLFPRER
jgi:hypothetical protein